LILISKRDIYFIFLKKEIIIIDSIIYLAERNWVLTIMIKHFIIKIKIN